MLGFECTINPQTFIKIVGAIFEKIEIFKYFLCELLSLEFFFFFSFRYFFGERRQCHTVVFRMYYKLTKFDEIRWSHFLENRNFTFFLCELPLILRVAQNQK